MATHCARVAASVAAEEDDEQLATPVGFGLFDVQAPTRSSDAAIAARDALARLFEVVGKSGDRARRRRRSERSDRPFRGRALGSRSAATVPRDIAWVDSIRASTLERVADLDGPLSLAVALGAADLRERARALRRGRLLVLAVDASGSMGGERMALVRRLCEDLLRVAYLTRDRVALVAFRGSRAEVLLEPTVAVERARAALDGVPSGGTTPLAAGLERAARLIERQRATTRPALVLLSDGRATVGGRGEPLLVELEARARALASQSHVQILFLDATPMGADERPARRLARWLGAERVRLY